MSGDGVFLNLKINVALIRKMGEGTRVKCRDQQKTKKYLYLRILIISYLVELSKNYLFNSPSIVKIDFQYVPLVVKCLDFRKPY
jgi:hypothetical protein